MPKRQLKINDTGICEACGYYIVKDIYVSISDSEERIVMVEVDGNTFPYREEELLDGLVEEENKP